MSICYGENIDITDKKKCIDIYVRYMLARTQQMFRYEGLPETIPQRELEFMLQTNGNVCFYKHENNLFVYTGGLGGVPDVYYRPTIYTIASPAQELSVMAKIDVDCVVMLNDSLYQGLLPMMEKYAYLLTEADISLYICEINERLTSLITASDDRQKREAEIYLDNIVKGKLGVISDSALLEGIKTQPVATSGKANSATQIIETIQYLKGAWYQDIGLSSAFNMKRTYIGSDETQLNDDLLLPLVDDMLNCRRVALKKVNDMFGTNIEVYLNSAWEDRHEINNHINETDTEVKEVKEVKEDGGDVNV